MIYSALNIQYPISQLILNGQKTVETRLYPLPKKYLGRELLFIETPGREGKFQARIVGTIRFGRCFQYDSKRDFYADFKRHLVQPDSEFAWKTKAKWGWEIESIKIFRRPLPAPERKGIKFTTGIQLDGPQA
jgi:hypothetical protein